MGEMKVEGKMSDLEERRRKQRYKWESKKKEKEDMLKIV